MDLHLSAREASGSGHGWNKVEEVWLSYERFLSPLELLPPFELSSWRDASNVAQPIVFMT